VFAFALMIHDGIAADHVECYLHQRHWVIDAARLLDLRVEDFTDELITTMVSGGAITITDDRLHAAAEHTPVDPATTQVPWPRQWPLAPTTNAPTSRT
jgi:hypothetical protein